MALQGSGAISISQIKAEKSETSNSLTSLSTNNINQNSASRPNATAPHSMSEFYSYDHSYSPPPPPPSTYDGALSSQFARDYREACEAFRVETQVYKSGSSSAPASGDVFWVDSAASTAFTIREPGWYKYQDLSGGGFYALYLIPGDEGQALIEGINNC